MAKYYFYSNNQFKALIASGIRTNGSFTNDGFGFGTAVPIKAGILIKNKIEISAGFTPVVSVTTINPDSLNPNSFSISTKQLGISYFLPTKSTK